MADKDNVSKVFLGDRRVFADAFNGLLLKCSPWTRNQTRYASNWF